METVITIGADGVLKAPFRTNGPIFLDNRGHEAYDVFTEECSWVVMVSPDGQIDISKIDFESPLGELMFMKNEATTTGESK